MSRHDLAAVPMAAVRPSATALGIYGGFRLYTLRRAQPLSKCRHTGAGHSCRRFRLHDRRASYSSQCLDAPAIWCSVFPPSAPWPLEQASFSARKGQCFAAWRVRPSGPDVWADALVRRMYPGKRRGLGGKRKSEAGAQGHTLPHSHCRIIVGFASHFCGRYFLIFLR